MGRKKKKILEGLRIFFLLQKISGVYKGISTAAQGRHFRYHLLRGSQGHRRLRAITGFTVSHEFRGHRKLRGFTGIPEAQGFTGKAQEVSQGYQRLGG
jgi:hypothetical protein